MTTIRKSIVKEWATEYDRLAAELPSGTRLISF